MNRFSSGASAILIIFWIVVMIKDEWTREARFCPSCKGVALSEFDASAHDGRPGETVSIIECLVCQFAWQPAPRRSVGESAEYFETAYNPASERQGGYFESNYKNQIVEMELDYLATLPAVGRRLVDVGGGSGAFAIAAAKQGWLTSTVDPALDVDALASLGVRAFKGYLSAVSADDYFDVVTIWDVIEHVEEPARFLAEIRGRVKSGAMLILSTGNYKSLDRLRGGKEHWIYQHDHRWYFSPDSIRRLLSETGFKEVAICNRVLRPGWAGAEKSSELLWRNLLVRALRHPWKIQEAIGIFQRERAAKQWPQNDLPIFTMVAQAI